MKRNRTMTLLELIIAIILLTVIVLAAAAFSMSTEFFLHSSRKMAVLAGEINYILSHIQNNVSIATGDSANPGILITASTLTIRQDLHPAYRTAQKTPQDYTDDTWVRYEWNANTLLYCQIWDPDQAGGARCEDGQGNLASFLVLSRRVDASASPQFVDAGIVNQAGVRNITLRYDISSPVDSRRNPSVSLPAVPGTFSFVSTSHSAN